MEQGLKNAGVLSAGELEKKLNRIGAEGWEFIASITHTNEEDPYLIFKRPYIER